MYIPCTVGKHAHINQNRSYPKPLFLYFFQEFNRLPSQLGENWAFLRKLGPFSAHLNFLKAGKYSNICKIWRGSKKRNFLLHKIANNFIFLIFSQVSRHFTSNCSPFYDSRGKKGIKMRNFLKIIDNFRIFTCNFWQKCENISKCHNLYLVRHICFRNYMKCSILKHWPLLVQIVVVGKNLGGTADPATNKIVQQPYHWGAVFVIFIYIGKNVISVA